MPNPPLSVTAIPNLLSVMRLGLAAGFPLASPSWRLPMVVAGGLSDWLDGAIARRFNARSSSGALLDALADKLFALSVLLTLAAGGTVEWWEAACLITRDLVVAAVAAYAAAIRDWPAFRRMTPSIWGKATTLVLFVWFVLVLSGDLEPALEAAIRPVLVLAASCSAAAAVDYLTRFVGALRERHGH